MFSYNSILLYGYIQRTYVIMFDGQLTCSKMEKFIKHDWARNALCEKNRLLKFELILNRNLKNFKDNHRLV